jgi:hypothetical protein
MLARIRRALDELFKPAEVPLSREDAIRLGGEILALRAMYLVLISDASVLATVEREFLQSLEKRAIEAVAGVQLGAVSPDLAAQHRRAAERAIRANFASFVFKE